MSRVDKIRKLNNAVRQYRGLYDWERTSWKKPEIKWKIRSAPSHVVRVKECLSRFRGLDIGKAVSEIDSMKAWDEYHKWLNTLP